MDTRYHWIREFIQDEMVKVKYVKSEDNVADICTKNLQGKLFDKHSNKLVHDMAFLTQCLAKRMGRDDTDEFFTRLNTRSIGRGEPNPKKWYEEEEDRWKNPIRNGNYH